jgi:hypothetical protein
MHTCMRIKFYVQMPIHFQANAAQERASSGFEKSSEKRRVVNVHVKIIPNLGLIGIKRLASILMGMLHSISTKVYLVRQRKLRRSK